MSVIEDTFPDGPILDGPALDRLRAEKPVYLVFIIARSGSTWLTELGAASRVLGMATEWFNPDFLTADRVHLGCVPPRLAGIRDINLYLHHIAGWPGQAAGTQLSVSHVDLLRSSLPSGLRLSDFDGVFYLRRRDLTVQSVSLWRSARSGYFHSYQDSPEERAAFANLKIDSHGILDMARHLLDQEVALESLFARCAVKPVRLFYEDLADNPLAGLNQMTRTLGLPHISELPATTLRRVSDQRNADMIRQFESECAEELQAIMTRRPEF